MCPAVIFSQDEVGIQTFGPAKRELISQQNNRAATIDGREISEFRKPAEYV
jgi:hypothetical protein